MAKTDTWMPIYIGDYLADTMHLNTLQHGAYMLLLMHHWRNGPLPNDDVQLAAIARCDPASWRKLIGPVLRGFFSVTDSGLCQKRLMSERAFAGELTQTRAKSGAAGAAKRWGKNSKEDGKPIANAMANASESDGPLPSPSHIQKKKEESPPTPKQPGAGKSGGRGVPEAEFDVFYGAYPRKVGKDAARRAFAAARRKVSMTDLIAGLKRFQWPADPQYCPHPSTWLNAGRWADEAMGDPVLRAAGLDDNGNLLEPEPLQFLQLESQHP